MERVVRFALPQHPTVLTASSYAFSIAEDAGTGTEVGMVAASEPDKGDAVTYSIVAGNGAGRFDIDGASGAITVAGDLDHETDPSHSLTVQASDTHGGADTVTVTISVTDVAEPPDAPPTIRVDLQESFVGQTVTMTAATPSSGGTVSS